MKISVTSDLHGYLPFVEACDLLCICGDICPTSNHNVQFQEKWLISHFVPWINNLKVDKVIFIAGNHDFWFERYGDKKDKIEEIFGKPTNGKVVYLHNEAYEYKSLKIFGTPYCRQFGNWAFMHPNKVLKKLYSKIPEKLDILITHDAPELHNMGAILEKYPVYDVGNVFLAVSILNKKPRYAFCGHIHSGNHNLQCEEGINMVNVSLCNEEYQPINKIFKINI